MTHSRHARVAPKRLAAVYFRALSDRARIGALASEAMLE